MKEKAMKGSADLCIPEHVVGPVFLGRGHDLLVSLFHWAFINRSGMQSSFNRDVDDNSWVY